MGRQRVSVGLVIVSMLLGCGRRAFDTAPSDGDGVDGLDLARGLVAHWPLDDDPQGGIAMDVTGNSHHAVCVSGSTCPQAASGRVGAAVRCDGVSHIYRVSGHPAFNGTAFTIAAWVRIRATLSNRGVMVGKILGTVNDNSWQINIENDRRPFVYAAGSGLYATGPATPESWTHIAATWDGAWRMIYRDGQMQNADALAITFDGGEVTLCGDVDQGVLVRGFLEGDLDDVRVYDRVLSDSEIAALAQLGA